AIRGVLVGEAVDPSWSKRARAAIDLSREEHAFLREEASPIRPGGPEALTWWNFAGGRANILLAQMIERELGGKVTARDFSVTCKEEAGRSEVGLRRALAEMRAQGRPTGEDARAHGEGAARSRLSK